MLLASVAFSVSACKGVLVLVSLVSHWLGNADIAATEESTLSTTDSAPEVIRCDISG